MYVLEPSEQETLQILQGLSERYERHHHCCYDDEALEAAVKLSHTYIADRFLPDKVRGVCVCVLVKGAVCRSLKGGVVDNACGWHWERSAWCRLSTLLSVWPAAGHVQGS